MSNDKVWVLIGCVWALLGVVNAINGEYATAISSFTVAFMCLFCTGTQNKPVVEKRRLQHKLNSVTKSRDMWRAKAKDAELALRCRIEKL